MHSDARVWIAALLAQSVFAGAALATDPDPRIEDLERRIEELEAKQDGAEARPATETTPDAETPTLLDALPAWAQRVRLGGSANTGWYGGEQNSVFHDEHFQVWDARFFIDAELGEDVRIGDQTLFRNVGFSFEWDLVRLGDLMNDVGELYTEFQGIAGSSWGNLQVGRFEIPVGESYLLYSRGYADNPFITNVVGGPWFWDEGVRIYGSDPSDRFGYVASVADGETSFDSDLNSDYQYTLKLFANPTHWLHVSASGLYTGKIGSRSSAGSGGALWLGEAWARAFGSGTSVPNYQDGVLVADGPNRIEETNLLGADVIVSFPGKTRIWLGYGSYAIDQNGGGYDRRLHYWVAELLLYGGLISPRLDDVYTGFRAHGLGTYDRDKGYLLDSRRAETLGYNMKSINAYSFVLGWKMLRFVTLRAEYTHRDIDLVRGAKASLGGEADDVDSWGVEVGIQF